MLTACAAERNHQVLESPALIGLDMRIHDTIYMVKETEHFTIILKEFYDRLIAACQFFIRLISSRIMDRSAIEDITAAVSGRISRHSPLE